MNNERYIRDLKIEINELESLIKFMMRYNIPFTGYPYLINHLRDLRIKLADVEAIITTELIEMIQQN
jgi:hypothetical protein